MQFCVPHIPSPSPHLPPESTHPWLDLALVPEANGLALGAAALSANNKTTSQNGEEGGGGGGGEGGAVTDIHDLSQDHMSVDGGSIRDGSIVGGSLAGGSLAEDTPFGTTPVPAQASQPPPPRYILTGRINGNFFEYTHSQKDLDEHTFDTSTLGSRDSSAGGARRALNVGVRDLYFPDDPPSTVNVNIPPVLPGNNYDNEDLTGRILPDNRSLGYGLVKFFEDNNRAVGTFSYRKMTESPASPSSPTTATAATATTNPNLTGQQAVLLVGPIIGPPKIQLYKPKATHPINTYITLPVNPPSKPNLLIHPINPPSS